MKPIPVAAMPTVERIRTVIPKRVPNWVVIRAYPPIVSDEAWNAFCDWMNETGVEEAALAIWPRESARTEKGDANG